LTIVAHAAAAIRNTQFQKNPQLLTARTEECRELLNLLG
jgi:hypothetical protein